MFSSDTAPTPRRAHFVAAAACVLLGAMISTLPHAVWWASSGDPTWIADHDDLFYLALGGRAYDSPRFSPSDPVVAKAAASIYRPLPLVPGVVAARWLHLGRLGVGLAWRFGAGATIGLAFYLLLAHLVRRPGLAAGLTALLLVDCGLLEGRPLVRTFENAARIVAGRPGTLLDAKPLIHPEWRVATPALTFAYLLLALWLLLRARERPTWIRLALAGAGFGLLFHVYVYYWTAFGLALVLGLAIDAGHRRVYWYTGWLGGLIGLPAVVLDFLLKRSTSPDWLLRTDKFLPIGRFDELLIPRVATTLIVLAAVIAWWKRRDLLPIALLAIAGLLLTNHQVITKLQIENFHWDYVWGPALSILLVVLAAGAVSRGLAGRWATWGFGLLVALGVVSGLGLRCVEAHRSAESRQLMDVYQRYLTQRAGASMFATSRTTVAGDLDFVNMAVLVDGMLPLSDYMVVLSPAVDNAEMDERLALNALLRGRDRSAFESEQRVVLDTGVWGPWARHRDPAARRDRLAARLAAFDALSRDLPAACDRFDVQTLALPLTDDLRPPPAALAWRLLQDGPTWRVWQRLARDSSSPGATNQESPFIRRRLPSLVSRPRLPAEGPDRDPGQSLNGPRDAVDRAKGEGTSDQGRLSQARGAGSTRNPRR